MFVASGKQNCDDAFSVDHCGKVHGQCSGLSVEFRIGELAPDRSSACRGQIERVAVGPVTNRSLEELMKENRLVRTVRALARNTLIQHPHISVHTSTQLPV